MIYSSEVGENDFCDAEADNPRRVCVSSSFITKAQRVGSGGEVSETPPTVVKSIEDQSSDPNIHVTSLMLLPLKCL